MLRRRGAKFAMRHVTRHTAQRCAGAGQSDVVIQTRIGAPAGLRPVGVAAGRSKRLRSLCFALCLDHCLRPVGVAAGRSKRLRSLCFALRLDHCLRPVGVAAGRSKRLRSLCLALRLDHCLRPVGVAAGRSKRRAACGAGLPLLTPDVLALL